LIILDFPAFRLPKIPIWTRSADGVLFIVIVNPPLGTYGMSLVEL